MSTALGKNRVIRRAIATVCLSGTLEDKLDAVGAAGFDGVEIFEKRPHRVVVDAGGSAEALCRSWTLDRSVPTAVRMTAQRDERTHRLN
jgi:hypothetical protein